MNHPLFSALAIFVLFFGTPFSTNAQTALLEEVRQKLGKYVKNGLQEKIFVHTDQSNYLTGETLWFKVYLVEGSTHQLLDLSKVVYVEVLDSGHKPVHQAKIAMKDGIGHGSFYLPLSLKSGAYKLRAYTSWMKNFSPDFYFEKHLRFINTFLVPEHDQQQTIPALDLQFFPEGGDLVAGIRSKVAFKAVSNGGKGEDVKGVVVKENGDTVAMLDVLKFGMGHFFLTPEPGRSYKAIVSFGTNPLVSFDLPAVLEKGYGMHVKELNDEQLEVSVQSTFPDETVALFVHTRQQVKAMEARKTNGGKAVFKLENKEFGEGISHITLFNEKQQPVAERLYFTFPTQALTIHAETDKGKYANREQVNLNITTNNPDEKPAGAHLSIAVYQLDSLHSQNEDHILSYLWLSSDLKGHIESPAFYFDQKSLEAKAAMDNLMLTQGWRRFKWENVLKEREQNFKYLLEYEGHVIQAVVLDKESGAPLEGIPYFISLPGKLVQFYASKSNENGELKFLAEHFFGNSKMVFQSLLRENKFSMKIINPFSETFSDFPMIPFSLDKSFSDVLRLHHIQMQVQNYYWQDKKNQLMAPDLDSLAFFGTPDKFYLLDDYVRFPTMEEVMREYVYEVRVRKHNKKFIFHILNPTRQTFFSEPPLVLLDGVPVFDIDEIMAYNPLKVEKVEVVYDKYIFGRDLIYDGIVSYTTYKGNLEGFPVDPDLLNLEYEGLQLEREFYQPKYESETERRSPKPDRRQLLQWVPEMKTEESGQNHLSFYTSDLKGKFAVEIQGISVDGKAGVKTLFFEVGEEHL